MVSLKDYTFKYRLRKVLLASKEKVMYSMLLRSFMESYLPISISVFLSLQSVLHHSQ